MNVEVNETVVKTYVVTLSEEEAQHLRQADTFYNYELDNDKLEEDRARLIQGRSILRTLDSALAKAGQDYQ